jgi:hypothetical protein
MYILLDVLKVNEIGVQRPSLTFTSYDTALVGKLVPDGVGLLGIL